MGDALFIVVPDEPAQPAKAPAPKRAPQPRPEPRATLHLAVPSDLAAELKDAVSVIPGASLDELATEALRRVIAEHGPVPEAPKRRRRRDDDVFVIVT